MPNLHSSIGLRQDTGSHPAGGQRGGELIGIITLGALGLGDYH